MTTPVLAVPSLTVADAEVVEEPISETVVEEPMSEDAAEEAIAPEGMPDDSMMEELPSEEPLPDPFSEEPTDEGIPEDEFMEEPVDEFSEEVYPDEFSLEEGTPPEQMDAPFQEDLNPLNPAGDSLDQLIEMTINEDSWTAMLGELPCLDASESCVRTLQEMAIMNNPTLMEIEYRIEAVNEKIEEARANNQLSINAGILEPLVADLIQRRGVQRVPDPLTPLEPGSIIIPEERGFIENVIDIFVDPIRGINRVLSLIGVPLFRATSGGDPAVQTRMIAIADLQVKVAEIERSKSEMANALREEVVLAVLDFDTYRREFQVSQEIAQRDTLRLRIIEQEYRFAVGTMDTPQYLSQLNALDQQKAQTYRAWAQLRTQLTRIKILVLGGEEGAMF